jgi:hypothetical protein
MGGNISNEGDLYRLGLHFIGAPLRGEPNSTISVFKGDEPDIEITSHAMAWRSVPDGLGQILMYSPRGMA